MTESITKVIELIGNIYCPMRESDKKSLAAIMRPVNFKQHEKIIKIGDPASTFYFIEKGMSHSYLMKKKQLVTYRFDYEGHFVIAMESFLTDQPSSENIAALEPMQCYAIDKKDFERIAKDRVNLQLLLRKIVEQFIVRIMRYNRFMRFENAQQRYQIMCMHHPEVIRRAPLIHIATMLQMTPETLSRVRKAQWKNNTTTTENELQEI